MFFKGSRYEKVPDPDVHRRQRAGHRLQGDALHPADARRSSGHRVTSDERLDHIAWQHFRDAGALLAHLRRQPRAVAGRPPRGGAVLRDAAGGELATWPSRRPTASRIGGRAGAAGAAGRDQADRDRGPRPDGGHAADPARGGGARGRQRLDGPRRRPVHPAREAPGHCDRRERAGDAADRGLRDRRRHELLEPSRHVRAVGHGDGPDRPHAPRREGQGVAEHEGLGRRVGDLLGRRLRLHAGRRVDEPLAPGGRPHAHPARHRHPVPAAAGRSQRLRVLRRAQRRRRRSRGTSTRPSRRDSRRAR